MACACSTQCALDVDVKAERAEAAQQPRSVIVLGRAEATENAQAATDARSGRACDGKGSAGWGVGAIAVARLWL
jgi:hypothetical protein